MKEKLNLQEIVSKMAHETGASKKETEEFLRSLFAIIPDALLADKVVKISGLGVFKLVLVESRESVNVNTKEKYEIPARYKLSFVPDSQLKEMVNEAFSAFETVELDENATPDIEEEIQTGDIPDEDFTENDDDDKTVETFAKSENNKETDVDIEALLKYLEEENLDADLPEEPESDAALLNEVLREQDYKVQVVAEESQADNLPIEDENDDDTESREYIHHRQFRNKKETHRNRMWALAAFLIIALLATGIYYAREYGLQINFANKTEAVTNVAETQPTQESIVEAPQAEEPEEPEQKEEEAEPAKIIAKIAMDPTMTLTVIAQKYYGNKILWVYLYIANRVKIKNPNLVPSGTIIEVPAPEEYDIDAHDTASVRRANELAAEIQALFY